jgi:uracil-DNA glycosylase
MQPYDPRAHGALCDECPLKGKQVVPPEGDSCIVIIGDAPGKADEQAKKIYSGATGMKLNELLRRAGLPPRNQLLLTNAVLCRPEVPDEYGRKRFDLRNFMAWVRKQNVARKKEGHPPMKTPFDCCKPRLKAELKRAEFMAREAHKRDSSQFPNGAVVMPTGNFALAELMGVQKRAMKVLNYRGSVMSPSPEHEQ